MTTITDAQKGRLWGIARETGYTTGGVFELVHDYGYDAPGEVSREDYDEIVRVARDEAAAEEFNRKAKTSRPSSERRDRTHQREERALPNRPTERDGGRQIRDHRMA